MKSVYLDHCAATPVREEVAETMQPFLFDIYGNASSIHSYGQEARNAIEKARRSIAGILGADSKEIVFTSGGTESDNLAIKGIAHSWQRKGNHIITSAIEHPAVLNCCRYLEIVGFDVTYLPVDKHCLVDPGSVRNAIKPETILISIMLANNEIGAVQPIEEIGEFARSEGIIFHTDAVQAIGKIPVRADALGADLISLSGHKIYGPKGIGALYIRKGTLLTPLLHGGKHEMGYRPGTENGAAIAGLAKALELAERERKEFCDKTNDFRLMLEGWIRDHFGEAIINGHSETRLPNILNVSFKGVDGETLLMALDMKGIAVSTGSACSSWDQGESHVLKAMGVDSEAAGGSIRFSFGRLNSRDDILYVIEVLKEVIPKLRRSR